MYVGFVNLKKEHDRVNREALWQVLRLYDMGGKLLKDTRIRYVNSLATV